MIELQTGLPGACKTQYTLWRVEELRKKTGRPVFYSGIPINRDKLPDWQEIEAAEWFTAPPESIVVIDEAQRLFRPRPAGSPVPEYEKHLETHRHGGIDLILITQSPRLVSVQVRELVGRHLHAVRRWGMQWSTIHEWPECRLNVQSRKDSSSHQFKFRKEVYGWYKSAEAHTHKAAVPFRVWAFVALPVFLLALVGWIWHDLKSKAEGEPVKGEPSRMVAGRDSAQASSPRPMTADEYLELQRPRVPGLAYTAAAFDEVTKPTRAPYPAACVETASRCQCYTKQATRLEVPRELCSAIARGGFFIAWDEDREQGGQRAQLVEPVRSVQTAAMEPAAGAINLTPGYTPPAREDVGQARRDGAALRPQR